MKKTFLYLIIAFLIILYSLLIIENGTSYRSLDNYAYCMALGFDKGENSKFKISFQIPINSSGGSSSGSSEQSTSSIVNSVECENIDSGVNLMNAYISQSINLSHCKAIVISEELANEGIADIIYTLFNKVEISSQALVLISRVDANELLNKSVSSLETASARYFDTSINSAYTTGYVDKITLSNFFSALNDNFCQPLASLASVNSKNSQTTTNSRC